ncbi:MAG: hypothetical protein M3Y08_06990, partial [Fibrobacterota bacterium]|nr:hypothetical protein [Fibrobacterota bacterium]
MSLDNSAFSEKASQGLWRRPIRVIARQMPGKADHRILEILKEGRNFNNVVKGSNAGTISPALIFLRQEGQ